MKKGAAPGRCNVVRRGKYDLFDHQMPVDTFVDHLHDGQVLDEVCVTKLGEAFKNGDEMEVARALQDHADDLSAAGTTLQFAVLGSIQSVSGGYELKYEGKLYRLNRVFGAQLRTFGDYNDWLVTPY